MEEDQDVDMERADGGSTMVEIMGGGWTEGGDERTDSDAMFSNLQLWEHICACQSIFHGMLKHTTRHAKA